jgi:hypothetical protein
MMINLFSTLKPACASVYRSVKLCATTLPEVLLPPLSLMQILLPILMLAGGGTHAQQPEINWEQDAKRGTIIFLYDARTPQKDLPHCLALLNLSKENLDAGHYARIAYHHIRQMHQEVAQLPDSLSQAKLDDQVEIWPANCSKGKLSRVSQIRIHPAAGSGVLHTTHVLAMNP